MGRKRPVRPMDGMAESWEAAEEVRKSTREERVLLRCDGKPVFKPTVATISQHAHVLKPVMEWMHVQKSPPPVPDIKPLTSEIFRLYGLLNMEVGQDQVYREAWGVRLACGLIKRQGQRKEVSKAGIHSLLARSCFLSYCARVSIIVPSQSQPFRDLILLLYPELSVGGQTMESWEFD